METWYRVAKYANGIDTVEVESSTTNTVCIDGKRRAQVTGFESFFRTRREARSHFLSQISAEINMLKRQMDFAMGRREIFLRNEGGNDAT